MISIITLITIKSIDLVIAKYERQLKMKRSGGVTANNYNQLNKMYTFIQTKYEPVKII